MRSSDLAGFVFLAGAALPLASCDSGLADHAAADLDLKDYRRTFSETFERLDVSARGPGSRWVAHTPWHGDFGDAAFSDPLPGFPFATSGTMLRIEARKGPDGRWESGLIASRDHDGAGGAGFAQKFGYFEIDAKLPPGPGVWPAFWLVGIDPAPRAEVDVFEYYGVAPDQYHANVHVWAQDERRFGDGHVVAIPAGGASGAFNTYGVLIDEAWVTFYFNRREVWRTPTRPEFKQPMYMLADLALGSGWPIDRTPNPSFLYIRSIAAYQRRP